MVVILILLHREFFKIYLKVNIMKKIQIKNIIYDDDNKLDCVIFYITGESGINFHYVYRRSDPYVPPGFKEQFEYLISTLSEEYIFNHQFAHALSGMRL